MERTTQLSTVNRGTRYPSSFFLVLVVSIREMDDEEKKIGNLLNEVSYSDSFTGAFRPSNHKIPAKTMIPIASSR